MLLYFWSSAFISEVWSKEKKVLLLLRLGRDREEDVDLHKEGVGIHSFL